VEGIVMNKECLRLFYTFVENIFKHVINNVSKIKIQIKVIIETSNSISSSEKYTNTGIGKTI
jgi:hypothetical protein